jgi:hypothetical protein
VGFETYTTERKSRVVGDRLDEQGIDAVEFHDPLVEFAIQRDPTVETHVARAQPSRVVIDNVSDSFLK